jgi:hypothetical protein
MTRADICSSNDYDTQAKLVAALRDLGFVADDTWHDDPIFGVGLTRYRLGDRELTVFKDAWTLDVAGPQDLVEAVMRGLA